jgi:hypothetical protein
VAGQNRSSQRRVPAVKPAEPSDQELRSWLRSYSAANPERGVRFAYRAARDSGWYVNHKKFQRLWREEGLQIVRYARSSGPPPGHFTLTGYKAPAGAGRTHAP